jgi:hypothetical protein
VRSGIEYIVAGIFPELNTPINPLSRADSNGVEFREKNREGETVETVTARLERLILLQDVGVLTHQQASSSPRHPISASPIQPYSRVDWGAKALT